MGPGRRRFLFRYLLLVAAEGTGRVVAFASMVIVVRRFGPAGFGELGLAASLVTYMMVAGTCGLDLYAVRSVARDAASLRELAATVVTLRLILGLAAYLALLAVVSASPSLRPHIGLIALFGISVLTSATSLSWIPEGLQKTHVLALASLGVQALNLGLLLVALRMGPSLAAVPVAQVVAEGLVALGLFAWARWTLGRFDLPSPARAWPALLRRSAPIGGARLLRALSLGSDLILLGMFVSMTELGWYTGAYRLFLLGLALLAQYFVVLFPRMARVASEGTVAIRREIRSSAAFGLAVAVPASAVAALAAGSLLQRLFGASFVAAAPSLRLLIVALLLNFLGSHYRNALICLNRQHADLSLVATATVVHLVAKLIFIPLLGIQGAALGMLLGEAVVALLGWWLLRPRFEANLPTPPARAEVLARMPVATTGRV